MQQNLFTNSDMAATRGRKQDRRARRKEKTAQTVADETKMKTVRAGGTGEVKGTKLRKKQAFKVKEKITKPEKRNKENYEKPSKTQRKHKTEPRS